MFEKEAKKHKEAIVQSVCKYLEDKHIATFNFDNDSCVYQSVSAAL